MLHEATADRLINMVSTTADLLEKAKKVQMVNHYRDKLAKEVSEVAGLDLSEQDRTRFNAVETRCRELLAKPVAV